MNDVDLNRIKRVCKMPNHHPGTVHRYLQDEQGRFAGSVASGEAPAMKVGRSGGYVTIEHDGSRLSVKASNPTELRTVAKDVRDRAHGDESKLHRADRYDQAADIMERDDAARAGARRQQKTRRNIATRRKHDEFTAMYGAGVEGDRARKRLEEYQDNGS